MKLSQKGRPHTIPLTETEIGFIYYGVNYFVGDVILRVSNNYAVNLSLDGMLLDIEETFLDMKVTPLKKDEQVILTQE